MTQEAIALRTTGDSYPGLAVVQDVNKALDTVATDFAGPDDPAALAGPFMTWADTLNMLVKRRNAAGSGWDVVCSISANAVIVNSGSNAEIKLGGDPVAQISPAGIHSDTIKGANVLINSSFDVNQRQVSGTVTLAAGGYGHDRFKAGSAGCTYTYSILAGETMFSITAGSMAQVVEGANLRSGTYCASWKGTAPGRIDGGSYGASGITGTAVGGVNQTIEWGIGTLSLPKYERGSVPTPWVPYSGIYGGEAQAVLRYTWRRLATVTEYIGFGQAISTSSIIMQLKYPVPMRAPPTLAISGIQCLSASGGAIVVNTATANGISNEVLSATLAMASASFVAGNIALVFAPAGAVISLTAEI